MYLGKGSRTKVRQRGDKERDINPSIVLGTNIPVGNLKRYNYIRRVTRVSELCSFVTSIRREPQGSMLGNFDPDRETTNTAA